MARALKQKCGVHRAMEGPRAGIHNVEQHVNQLEQRLEDCLAHKADAAEVPTNYQVRKQEEILWNQKIRLFVSVVDVLDLRIKK